MKFLVTLQSELLKTKRSSALYLTLLTAILPFLMILEHLSSGPATEKKPPVWDDYFISGQQMFNYMLLPLFLVLASTLLMQLEYRNNTWKQVFASPHRPVFIFFSKFLVLHLLVLLLMVSYNAMMLLTALLLDLINKNSNFISYIERWREVLVINGNTYLTSLGISAITFWLALRFRNFIVPVAIGFGLWIMGPVLLLQFAKQYADKYVFALTFIPVTPKFQGNMPFYLLLSGGYGLVFLLLALTDFHLKKPRA